MRLRGMEQAVTKVTCPTDGTARRALFVLGAALMDGRHWQSAVQIVPTNRAIDEQEHLPQCNKDESIVLRFGPDK